MPRPLRRTLIIGGGAIALVALCALAVLLFLDINHYKPQLESGASRALGMDVHIDGRLSVGFFRGFHATVRDVRASNTQGAPVASAKKITLWIPLLPFLHGEFRVRAIELTQPRLTIEHGPEGKFDFDKISSVVALLGAPEGASVSIKNGTLIYVDTKEGRVFEASGIDLIRARLRLDAAKGPELASGLSMHAELACREIRAKRFAVSNLKLTIDGQDGVFELKPVTMRVFGGEVTGIVHADASGAVPHYQVHCSLPKFRIEEFLKVLSPTKAAEGDMAFTANLYMQGLSRRELLQSAAGKMSLRGSNLKFVGHDLDRAFSHFESTQSFSLVDIGAVFLAGPMGLVVTRSYNFATLFTGSSGTTAIETLVSEWSIEHGVAQANDVAMATTKNRIALQGRLNFVDDQFEDVTMAVVDGKGCAKMKQAIHGSFEKPVIEKPHIYTSITGPVVGVLKDAKRLLPLGPCKPFYTGTVEAPR
jgi:uncharacterized protein involved in outer membrane biogenesis